MQLEQIPDYAKPIFTFQDVRRVEHDSNGGDETVWEEMVEIPNWQHNFEDRRLLSRKHSQLRVIQTGI